MKVEKLRISDFTDVITGGTPSTSNREYWDGGHIPWVNSGDLNQGRIYNPSGFITEKGLENSSAKIMPTDSVLIALTGSTTGVSAILKTESAGNQSVTGILPSSRHYPEYLYYFFKTQRKRIFDAAWGGAQPHINQKYVKDYIVPLPVDLNDQKRIATILGKAEKLIAQRKETIKMLDDFLKSVFLDMFGAPVRNEKGWEEVVLSRLGTLDRGVSKHRPRNAPELLGGKYPLIQTGEVTNSGLYITSHTQTYSELGLRQSRLWPKGTMLITIAANIAQTSILTFDACFPDSIVGFTPFENECNVIYVHFLFSFLQKLLEKNAPQAAQKNINLDILRNLKVPRPLPHLQDKFASIVAKAEAIKQQYQVSLQELEDLYGSLSQRAFKGELDLSKVPIEEEPNNFSGPAPDEDKRYGDHFEGMDLPKEGLIGKDKIEKLLEQGWEEVQETVKGSLALVENRNKVLPKVNRQIIFDDAIGWEDISEEQLSRWIKERYVNYHFSFEMLHRYLSTRIADLPYYSTIDLIKKPGVKEDNTFKGFWFKVLSGEIS